MTLGRQTGSARASGLAAAVLCLSALACRKPHVGERESGAAWRVGTRIVLEDAGLDPHYHVVATFVATEEDLPLTADEVMALAPRFTLATLKVHPVDGLPAWRSQLLTGPQVAARLPPAGPGTPDPEIVTSARQPGYEAPAWLVDLGAGRYRYVFANALADFQSDEVVRVGVWLAKAVEPTEGTSSTIDFRPGTGVLDEPEREVVLDRSCQRCHQVVRSASGATGVRICVTCHTWQHSDPDTVDPAALDGATAATDPNPLELGRLIHRIHRGKNLPTLYRSSSTAAAPALPPAAAPPLPFFPGRNASVVGRKYGVVGANGQPFVYGHVVTRIENETRPAMVLAEGAVFPRELRDCDACHEGAPQKDETKNAISRRTCSGCHPDVWYQDTASAPITDQVHLAHTGGPQADDAECGGCHVAVTPTQSKVWAPIADIHVPPHRSPKFDRPVVEIVAVQNLKPGSAPTIKFKAYDKLGTTTCPTPSTCRLGPFPAPAPEPGGSVLPRTMHYYAGGWFGITVAGPTAPAPGLDYLLSEREDVLALFALAPDANGVFTYQFAAKVPAGASGTWAVGIEARRSGVTPFYDAAAQEFRWPYTGENLTEPPINPVVYVDTATGTFTAGVPDAAVPRRKVVAQEKCDRCHDPIPVHGKTRMRVEYCVLCHSPERTDWGVRPGVAKDLAPGWPAHPGVPATGTVNLGATLDGIEERSIDFKVMIHRIHTGGRKGVASLEGIEPHVVYGRYGTIWFFDEALFPGDLADCTTCHLGKSYTIEAIPADAPPTVANESATVLHAPNAVAHAVGGPTSAGCEVVPPIQAACLGCHASGATRDHARRKTVDGVETCAQCHVKGLLSVDVAHGLAPPSGAAGSSFSSIVSEILVPRCATSACHSGPPPAPKPRLDASAAYAALVDAPSDQALSLKLVTPGAPEESYLMYKLRGDAGTVGGSPPTPMPPPPDSLLDPADIAAIEAWIANGAPND